METCDFTTAMSLHAAVRTSDHLMALLRAQLDILARLLESLPESIPSNPSISQYDFDIDTTNVDEDGVYRLANRRLEVSFQTHISSTFKILERGDQLKKLMWLLEHVFKTLPPSEHSFFCEVWVERLIKAAEASGAVLSDKTGTTGQKRCVVPCIRGSNN